MALAWSQIPHVSSQDEVDVTKLEVLRRRHKMDIEAQGGKLSLTAFAVKAVAAALKVPPLSGSNLMKMTSFLPSFPFPFLFVHHKEPNRRRQGNDQDDDARDYLNYC